MLCNDANEALRSRSGKFTTTDPFVSLFYELLRDHIRAGTLEGIVQSVVDEPSERRLTNGYLGEYAQDVVERLRRSEVDDDFHVAVKRLKAEHNQLRIKECCG